VAGASCCRLVSIATKATRILAGTAPGVKNPLLDRATDDLDPDPILGLGDDSPQFPAATV